LIQWCKWRSYLTIGKQSNIPHNYNTLGVNITKRLLHISKHFGGWGNIFSSRDMANCKKKLANVWCHVSEMLAQHLT